MTYKSQQAQHQALRQSTAVAIEVKFLLDIVTLNQER